MASQYPSINDRSFDLLKKIANNTAELTDGGGTFLTQAEGDARYLQLTGGTLSGALSVHARVGIGLDSIGNMQLVVAGTPVSAGNTAYGIYMGNTADAYATTQFYNIYSNPRTLAAAFTASAIHHFGAGTLTIGAGSTVTVQNGFLVGSTMVGAANNYGFRGQLATDGVKNYNLYMDGAAPNYLVGTLQYGQGALSASAWGVSGIQLRSGATTYTNTSSSGTVATAVANSFAVPTFAASAATTFTDAANLYIAGDVAAGANVTLTNSYGLWNVGKTRLDGVTRITDSTASSTSSNGALVVSGGAGFGGNINSVGYLKISSSGLSGNFQAAITGSPTFVATATGFNAAFYSGPTTANTVVTYPKVVGLYVDDASKGAASTITEQIGVYIKAQTKGATNYGIYQAGTEANYFGGAIAIGNTVAAGVGVASTHKVTIAIGGVTYYLLASNV